MAGLSGKTHATAELTSDTTSQWIQESLTAQLHSLFDLRENWDGYGAKPLHDDTRRNAELALAVLKYATLQPDIIPNPNGTVSFEWETEKGEAYLEVGRSRFVALVRPNGSGDISMSGVVRDGFTTAIGNLAHIVEAALLPSVSHTQEYANLFGRLSDFADHLEHKRDSAKAAAKHYPSKAATVLGEADAYDDAAADVRAILETLPK